MTDSQSTDQSDHASTALTIARDSFRRDPSPDTFASLIHAATRTHATDHVEAEIVSLLTQRPQDPSARFGYFAEILVRNFNWPSPFMAREWGVVFAKLALFHSESDLQATVAWTAITAIFEKDRLAGSFAERVQAADALRRTRHRHAAASEGSSQDLRAQTYTLASESLVTYLAALAEDQLDRRLLDEAIAIGEESLRAAEPSAGYASAYSNTASALLKRYEWAAIMQILIKPSPTPSLLPTVRGREVGPTGTGNRHWSARCSQAGSCEITGRAILRRPSPAPGCLGGSGELRAWALAAICKLRLLAYAYGLVSHNLDEARLALQIFREEGASETEMGFLAVVLDLLSGLSLEVERVDRVLATVQDRFSSLVPALGQIRAVLSPAAERNRIPLTGGSIEMRPLTLIPFSKSIDIELAELAVNASSRAKDETPVREEEPRCD